MSAKIHNQVLWQELQCDDRLQSCLKSTRTIRAEGKKSRIILRSCQSDSRVESKVNRGKPQGKSEVQQKRFKITLQVISETSRYHFLEGPVSSLITARLKAIKENHRFWKRNHQVQLPSSGQVKSQINREKSGLKTWFLLFLTELYINLILKFLKKESKSLVKTSLKFLKASLRFCPEL